jgi:hypothetical protein
MADNEPYVFVMYERPDKSIGCDGPHDLGSDLSSTYAILRAMCPEVGRYWRVTMKPDRYGTHWPEFEDVTGLVLLGNHGPLPGGPAVANLVRKQKGYDPLPAPGRAPEEESTEGESSKFVGQWACAPRYDCATAAPPFAWIPDEDLVIHEFLAPDAGGETG